MLIPGSRFFMRSRFVDNSLHSNILTGFGRFLKKSWSAAGAKINGNPPVRQDGYTSHLPVPSASWPNG